MHLRLKHLYHQQVSIKHYPTNNWNYAPTFAFAGGDAFQLNTIQRITETADKKYPNEQTSSFN